MQTASGLKFPTNSHCICWLYHALSKIWRDRNISQTKGLRNTGTVRTQSPLHTAWVPPHPLRSGTQDPGPLYLVLCYLCLGQPIAHQPNTGWFHFHPCSESEPCPSLNTKERGQKLYTSFSEQLKCQMEPPKKLTSASVWRKSHSHHEPAETREGTGWWREQRSHLLSVNNLAGY